MSQPLVKASPAPITLETTSNIPRLKLDEAVANQRP